MYRASLQIYTVTCRNKIKVLDNAFTQHKNCSPLDANCCNQSVDRVETKKISNIETKRFKYLHEHCIDWGDQRFSLFVEKLKNHSIHQKANDANSRLHQPDVWELVFATIRGFVIIKTLKIFFDQGLSLFIVLPGWCICHFCTEAKD